MAKRAGRRGARRSGSKRTTPKRAATGRSPRRRASAKPRKATRSSKRRPAPRAAKRRTTKPLAARPPRDTGTRTKLPRLDRVRRTLDETIPSPPSSLNLDRHASAARTGRQELKEALAEHHEATPAIAAGDLDANWEQAYFAGDEAPGGDNPTPDQDVVEDIGRSIGLEYEDNEELKSTDKVTSRDKHRWELDPASAEDFKDRK
jgi:hypothetical protein